MNDKLLDFIAHVVSYTGCGCQTDTGCLTASLSFSLSLSLSVHNRHSVSFESRDELKITQQRTKMFEVFFWLRIIQGSGIAPLIDQW